ncbi:unnamed protein product, partial [Pylaiella littoralis]
LFDSLNVLEELFVLDNYGLTCVPDLPANAIANVFQSNTEVVTDGVCGCTPTEVIFCDEDLSCQPGESGYTCVTATPAPTPPPSIAPTPAPSECLVNWAPGI